MCMCITLGGLMYVIVPNSCKYVVLDPFHRYFYLQIHNFRKFKIGSENNRPVSQFIHSVLVYGALSYAHLTRADFFLILLLLQA